MWALTVGANVEIQLQVLKIVGMRFLGIVPISTELVFALKQHIEADQKRSPDISGSLKNCQSNGRTFSWMMQSGPARAAQNAQVKHGTVLGSNHPQPAPIVDQATHVDPASSIHKSPGLAASLKLQL